MFSKSTVLFAVFSISIRLATATPPACLLAAINTQSDPANLPLLCGKDSSDVQQQIRELCGDDTDAALDAYKDTCKGIGKTISSETSESSSSKPSKTTSATSKSTNKSDAETTAEHTTDTDLSSSTSVVSVSQPVTFTSTYFDNECSCTKTATISSTAIVASTGFAIPTGGATHIGSVGPSGSSGSGPGSGPGSATTGPLIRPSATNNHGTSATPPSFTGDASKNLGASSTGILAMMSLLLATLTVSSYS